MKKGDTIYFKSRQVREVISKTRGANDRVNGKVWTEDGSNEYSVDFIERWREFGFLSIEPKKRVGKVKHKSSE